MSLRFTPTNLEDAKFSNFIVTTEAQRKAVDTAFKFATEIRCGFLVLIGPYGIGKTHLAVATGRKISDGLQHEWHNQSKGMQYPDDGEFWTQSEILRGLRESYSDYKAKSPVSRCSNVSCLVLDELGLSAGGRDELPMIHDILSSRYSNLKPTIITSNLSWPEICEAVGPRIADRLTEASIVVEMDGPSYRSKNRANYFSNHVADGMRSGNVPI